MRPRDCLFALAAIVAVAAASPAAAHVSIVPESVAPGAPVEVTVRVPDERGLATTRVRILYPAEVTFVAAGPAPGWRIQPLTTADGRPRGAIYTGGRIGPGEYGDFPVLVTPTTEGAVSWRVEQTYSDGITKPWIGPPEPEGAAVSESGPSDPGPAGVMRISAAAAPAGAVSSGDGDSSPAGIWLGVIAIVIAAAAGLGVGFLWSTRPMPLPEDPDAPEPEPTPSAPPRKPAGKRRRRS